MRHTMEVKISREILFLESPFITLMVEEFTLLLRSLSFISQFVHPVAKEGMEVEIRDRFTSLENFKI